MALPPAVQSKLADALKEIGRILAATNSELEGVDGGEYSIIAGTISYNDPNEYEAGSLSVFLGNFDVRTENYVSYSYSGGETIQHDLVYSELLGCSPKNVCGEDANCPDGYRCKKFVIFGQVVYICCKDATCP